MGDRQPRRRRRPPEGTALGVPALRFLSKEDLEAVVRAVPDDELGAVERPLYPCAAMTGLRQGELIGLRWCDIDWIAGRVRVAESYTRGAFDSPKSHRGRSVPMSDRLAGELERHFQRTRWRGERDLVFAIRSPAMSWTPRSCGSASAAPSPPRACKT